MNKRNTNSLEGFICPNVDCRQTAKFTITCTTDATVTDDGVEDHADMEWDDDSTCVCPECGHDGKVKDFQTQLDIPEGESNNEYRRIQRAEDGHRE